MVRACFISILLLLLLFYYFLEENLSQLFPYKSIEKIKEKNPKKSALSIQIERHPTIQNNPFNEYAKFDGRVYEGSRSRKYSIFLTMLLNENKYKPIEVTTLLNAKVQDLIGYICWFYTNENWKPKLKPNVNNYCLRIAEENGEVDADFPNLNPKEPLEKFGFPVLALVEKKKKLFK